MFIFNLKKRKQRTENQESAVYDSVLKGKAKLYVGKYILNTQTGEYLKVDHLLEPDENGTAVLSCVTQYGDEYFLDFTITGTTSLRIPTNTALALRYNC